MKRLSYQTRLHCLTPPVILKIKSVKSKPLPGMPFGEGPTRALEYVLNLANSFGLGLESGLLLWMGRMG